MPTEWQSAEMARGIRIIYKSIVLINAKRTEWAHNASVHVSFLDDDDEVIAVLKCHHITALSTSFNAWAQQ